MENFSFLRKIKYLNYFLCLFFISSLLPTNSFAYDNDNWIVYLDSPDWTIPFSFLHSNDATPTPILEISITGDPDYPFFGTQISPTINFDESTIELPVLTEGLYVFYVKYWHDDMDPSMTQIRTVFVVVTAHSALNVIDCCPDNCNLVCESNFENFTINEPIASTASGKIFTNAQTAPFKFNNYTNLGEPLTPSNDAYISSDGQNKKLILLDRFGIPKPVVLPKGNAVLDYVEYEQGYESGFIFKLREPISINETVHFNFDATIYGINQTSNNVESHGDGHIRLFAMESDFSKFAMNNIEYPYTNIINPFTFDGAGKKGYYINSGLETDYFGIPVAFEYITFVAPYYYTSQNALNMGIEGLDEFQNIDFDWTNTTAKSINAIMIVGDANSPIISELLSISTRDSEVANYYSYAVAVDNFQVTKSNKHIPLCITGDESEVCLGNCTHIVEYKVCWCDEPNEKAEPFTFDLSINDMYSGIDVILPSGDFDSDGIASVTLDEPGDCATLTFEVNIDLSVGEGNIELPLNFGSEGDCEMCTDGAYISSFTPAVIEMGDCNFTCKCDDLNNIGAINTTTNWSSLTSTQKEKRCYSVEGTLVMDENVSFVDKRFIMNGDSKISILGNFVEFESCELKGCEYLWKGIELNNVNSYLSVHSGT